MIGVVGVKEVDSASVTTLEDVGDAVSVAEEARARSSTSTYVVCGNTKEGAMST